jgi:plasmid stabilization system protein ParE
LKRRVVVRREARDELTEAAEWYRSKSPALVARFRAAVRQTVLRISERPAVYAEVSEGVRRALTNQFPYAIFFSDEPSGIAILAVKHQAQDPASWPKRF